MSVDKPRTTDRALVGTAAHGGSNGGDQSMDRGAQGIFARGLTKRFGSVTAVRDASFVLPTHGVCGLLGPNGAGKTTTIRMLAGVLTPEAGELRIAGIDALAHGAAARALVGYLPESAPLYPELTVREYLRYRADIGCVAPRARRAVIEAAMNQCDVNRFANRLCGELSKGMQQRVGLAATLLGDPPIVILDEPSVGLDPAQTLAFRELIRRLGETRLVLLSSHQFPEVESVCSELLIIADGRVLLHESMDAFRSRAAADRRHRIESERSLLTINEARALCQDAVERTLADGWIETVFSSTHSSACEMLARIALREHITLRVIEATGPRLLEVFVSLVEGAVAK